MKNVYRVLLILLLLLAGVSSSQGQGGIYMSGTMSYDRVGPSITFGIETIWNSNPSYEISGSLAIELWATASPYSGGLLVGYKLCEVGIGTLQGGYYFQNVVRTTSFSEPPAGSYNIVFVLAEWNGFEYLTDDWANFSSRETFGIAPLITGQPVSQSVNVGESVSFCVSASGSGPSTIQWYFNAVAIPGAVSPTLVINNVQPSYAGAYNAIVSNPIGYAISSFAILTVNVVPISITSQPQSQSVISGGSVTFSVQVTGTAPSFQWLFNGVNIPGANSSSYTINGVCRSDAGEYKVQVSNVAGTVESAVATLTVQYIPVKGSYQGLFYDTNGVAQGSSGFFNAAITDKGTFSAKLQLAGKSYSLSGQFSVGGVYSQFVARKGLSPLSVQLDLAGGDMLSGFISDGTWTAELFAERALYSKTNPAPQAGKYTMIIVGGDYESTTAPAGHGYGTVTVDTSGKVSFSGTLGDGTKVSQKTILSGQGQWPFYASLYSGRGSMLSWITFADDEVSDFGGDLSWIKPAMPTGKLYPAGFTDFTYVVGSRYITPVAGSGVLNFSDGMVMLEGGNLNQSIVNQVAIGANNKVTNLSGNKLTLTIKSSSGLFNGKVTDPATGKAIPFNGVVLQKQNGGWGCFMGTKQSGLVFLGPE